MNTKKILKIFLVLLFFVILLFFFQKFLNENKIEDSNYSDIKQNDAKSNIIKEIIFSSKDKQGNEYILKAEEGEIDLTNDKIIYLKKIKAQIILNNSDDVLIFSDFGKYNIENSDTIFSENILIKHLDNRIKSNYMEFSLNKNLMIITKNVVYSNEGNLLKADTVKFNIETKKVNIFMNDSSKKIKIISNN
jgi:hypothetical protein